MKIGHNHCPGKFDINQPEFELYPAESYATSKWTVTGYKCNGCGCEINVGLEKTGGIKSIVNGEVTMPYDYWKLVSTLVPCCPCRYPIYRGMCVCGKTWVCHRGCKEECRCMNAHYE